MRPTRTKPSPSSRGVALAGYDFDAYRTWIVRDGVLSRIDDAEGEVQSSTIERVPHPTVEDVAARGYPLSSPILIFVDD